MTAGELIDTLKNLPQDLSVIVKIGEDSRDNPIYSTFSEAYIAETKYVLCETDFDEEESVIILRTEN